MKWATREKARVDRIACPWLIRKFVDPQAEFLYVPNDQVLETARRESAVSFDCRGPSSVISRRTVRSSSPSTRSSVGTS